VIARQIKKGDITWTLRDASERLVDSRQRRPKGHRKCTRPDGDEDQAEDEANPTGDD
jgi:hypothetical protein